MPTEKEIARLYRQISDLAFQSGLAMAVFQPQDRRRREDLLRSSDPVNAEGNTTNGNSRPHGWMAPDRDLTEWRLPGIDRPTGKIGRRSH